jgi:L-2-hydroxyglutarate oxidase LhgO
MDAFDADAVVIGAGAVGLAIARELAVRGRGVLVIEAESAIATGTSSRNSEVVHAGLYYRTGSLKARLCVEGRRRLVEHCAGRGVTLDPCGKFVVAAADEAAALERLHAQAIANGVERLELIDGDAARRIEPELAPDVRLVLVSPVSGIFDSHAYFLTLLGDVEDAGGALALNAPLIAGEVRGGGLIELDIGGAEPARIRARSVVNAAGHGALALARTIRGGPDYPALRMRYAKGNYFTVSGRSPFSRLVYPMPTTASLGLHLTIDLAGRTRVGPDVEWLEAEAAPPFDYAVDPARAAVAYGEVARYWPGVRGRAIAPDYSGVRPKLVGPGEPPADFFIDGPADHGVAGLVHLFGIESPGLTASLAIGAHVAALLAE